MQLKIVNNINDLNKIMVRPRSIYYYILIVEHILK